MLSLRDSVCICFLTSIKFWLLLRFYKTVNFNYKISRDNCRTFHFASDFQELSNYIELRKVPHVLKRRIV